MSHLLLSLAAKTARLLPMSVKKRLYNLGPISQLLRSALNKAAPSGLTEVTVAAGALAGVRLFVNLKTEKDYWLGTYEAELQRSVGDLAEKGTVAYDVGANIGYITLLLARALGMKGKVYAFEALPTNIERLRANVAMNPDFSRVEIIPQAVMNDENPVRFLVHSSGAMGKAEGSPGRQERYEETITVPGISLDTFVFEQGYPAPQLIKLDIEGGEVFALPGMYRVLEEARPLILLELHGPEAAQVAWKILTAAGYKLYWMRSGYPTILTPQALGWNTYVIARPS